MVKDFSVELGFKAQKVNETLERVLSEQQGIESRLYDAMAYCLCSPGKRIRGSLVLWSCEVVSGSVNSNAETAAAAVEMVHTYSLIHDDLPAMDDDDLRRGRATCHKAFDEATAILAGDGLLTLAFEVLAKDVDNPHLAVKLIGQLSEAAGCGGMIAGQMADLKAEGTEPDRELLEYIHINKTAKMFRASAQMGALVGAADIIQLRALSEYGLKMGLGFQIADDILDVSGTSEQLGKTAGKDEKSGKMTYPSLIGLEKSRELEKKLASEAAESLELFGDRAEILRQLSNALAGRVK
ncbi:MAG: polyprenyl synthetase family protein [Candidatus Brocadiia bacterium]|nr:MAG: polyprenyl synthetase family protein [Candidatus Brocadiia bacterium]